MKKLLLLALLGTACREHHKPDTDQGANVWVKDVCPVDHPELWIGQHHERCCDGTTYQGCLDWHTAKPGDDFCTNLPLSAMGVPFSELHLMRDGTWLCCAPGQAINCGN